jgi:hypothetical protein
MKAVVDCERHAKPAYFAFADALRPLTVQARSDRTQLWAGDPWPVEAWIINDSAEVPRRCRLAWQLRLDGRIVAIGGAAATVPARGPACVGLCAPRLPATTTRATARLELALIDGEGRVRHSATAEALVFPRPQPATTRATRILGRRDPQLAALAARTRRAGPRTAPGDLVLLAGAGLDAATLLEAERLVRAGASLLVVACEAEGAVRVPGGSPVLERIGMGELHHVCRDTGHALVEGLRPHDVRLWFSPQLDRIAPMAARCFAPLPGWNPVLTTVNGGWGTPWLPRWIAAERRLGAGRVLVSTLRLAGFADANPVAHTLAHRLLG